MSPRAMFLVRALLLLGAFALVSQPPGRASAQDAGVEEDEDWEDEEEVPEDEVPEEDEDEDESGEGYRDAYAGDTEELSDDELTAAERAERDAARAAGDDEEEAEEEDAEVEEEAAESGPTTPPGAGLTAMFAPPPPPRAPDDFDLTIPPILHYHRENHVTTTAVFPAFYLREEPGSSELVIPPIYHREGAEPFDVVFPFFWWYRGELHHTWIAGPVWHHDAPDGHDFGIAPLVMTGRHRESYYHIVPPLLTVAFGDEDEDYMSAAALFYRFRIRESENWGVFPFLWVRNSPTEEYQFIPPLVFRWRNPERNRTITIVPPVYLHEDPGETFWGIAGLLHHDSGPGFHSTTIPPLLFHFSEEAATDDLPASMRLGTPLFLYMNERGAETFVTYLYQYYRGATQLDAVLPLFLWTRDPRDHSEVLMASPLVWHWSNPGADNWLAFPLWLHLDDRGRSTTWITPFVGSHTNHETHDETTWVLPTIQVSRWHDGDAVNVHPVWYYEDVPSHRFTVLAPFWWDFEQFDDATRASREPAATRAAAAAAAEGEDEEGRVATVDEVLEEEDDDAGGGAPRDDGFGLPTQRHTRYTVAFPIYYRIVEAESETQVLLTTYFRRREWLHEGRWEYEFHGSGLFDFGERSDGEHWWRVLYGLVGFEHRLDHDRLWLFYIPIDFGHPLPPGAEGTSRTAVPPSDPAR
jgi:hypothetical protein